MSVRVNQPVSKWTINQAAKWMKHCVRTDRYSVTQHFLDEAQNDVISLFDAIECIRCGKISNWEPGEHPVTRQSDMRLRFTIEKKLKSIAVIVAISDHNPNSVVITTWALQKRK